MLPIRMFIGVYERVRLCLKDSGASLILVPVQLPLVVRMSDGYAFTDLNRVCVSVCVH